jgi:hypothetical protein
VTGAPVERAGSSPEEAEERSQLTDEQLGLLQRGEAPAAVELVPVPDVGGSPRSPPAVCTPP